MLLIPTIFNLSILALPESEIDLSRAFERAEASQETLRIQGEVLTQAQSQYWQAIGTALPSIKGTGSYTWQDDSTTSSTSGSGNQSQLRITGTQPLFKGLREWMAVHEADELVQVQSLLKQASRLELYGVVAKGFYAILTLSAERALLKRQHLAVEERVSDLTRRVRIGRSKKSDLLSSQVSLETLAAQVALIEAQLAAETENFRYLTRIEGPVVLRDTESIPQNLPEVQKFLDGVDKNPSLSAKRKALNAAKFRRRGAWGETLPTADLSGNYYLKRSGILKDVDWDLKIEVTLPFFEGGTTWQKIQQARSQERKAELEWLAAKRELESTIRSQYLRLDGSLKEFEKLDQARKTAHQNFKEQSSQYELGLVTNLDVLAALNSQTDVERSREKALYSAKLNMTQLELYSGLQRSLQQ